MTRLSGFVFLVFLSSAASALELRADLVEDRNYVGASFEFSQFKLDEGSMSGTGAKIDFNHSFNKDLSMEVFLSSAINGADGVQASFTGFGGYAYYNLLGNCCDEKKSLFLDGQPVLTERLKKDHSLRIGAGLDQIFLNGSKGVYSSSGIGFAADYQFVLLSYQFKASTRYTMMTSNQSKVQGTFFGLGMVFPL